MTKLSSATKQELLRVMRRFKRENFQPYIDYEGITPSEMNVILSIHRACLHGIDPVQPSIVASWLHLTPSALSQTLKLVEEKGFVERRRACTDFRAVSLELTEKGTDVADRMSQAHEAFMDDLIECIGEEDIRHLLNTFDKVFDFLSQQADSGAIQRGTFGLHHPPCTPDLNDEDK